MKAKVMLAERSNSHAAREDGRVIISAYELKSSVNIGDMAKDNAVEFIGRTSSMASLMVMSYGKRCRDD